MPVFASIVGKFRGGPSGNMIRVEVDKEGTCKGEYLGKKGGRAGFQGKLIEGGKKLLGFWFDYDQALTPGSRFECTCVLNLDAADGNKLVGVFKTKGGGEEKWEAKRWFATDVPRSDGKIASFAFKSKEIFDRVTDDLKEKKAAWTEAARATALGESVSRRNFDGALEYIPSSAVGAEYMTEAEVMRMLNREEATHRDRVIAAYEAEIEKLRAKVAAGSDDLKPKLELKEKLLKGCVRIRSHRRAAPSARAHC